MAKKKGVEACDASPDKAFHQPNSANEANIPDEVEHQIGRQHAAINVAKNMRNFRLVRK